MTAALPNLKNYLQSKAGITEEQFEALTQNLKTATIEKGGILLQQGEICHHSFFVEQGLLRSYTIDDSGKEHIIQFATENWIISDRSSIFFNEPSDFFIDAVEPTTFVYLDQQFIHKASEISAAFRIFNEKALQNHIRHLQKRINLLLAATAEQRYLDFIKLYPDVTLRVPQWMIASYLGITPESLSRVRKELAKRNFKPY
ncbi:Crp/Fnr family transcriptional regulator [Flavobacterium supellecticarium]|uniref:Crp/Fnr family transcriptional regulator n=1 Tax=Flavobacterium supellecticarium TaxID=2565924 RepID=A0A4S4A462_9FLAO|nr:Crp/Fnr family transcriptional regulator [Flavobacterium supellecticarium]THF53088.1 Crp/Fnr family transcriptional regulator [Flavobacterium supellecticarium]